MTISLIKSSNFWPGGARPKKPRTQPRDTRSAGAYRAEVALLFLVQEARGPELGTTGRPAPRAGLALLFLVQEARGPKPGPQVGRRIEQRAADTEERRTLD